MRMYVELRFAGFSHSEIEQMNMDQLSLFYRFARARYFESVAYSVLAYHSKPRHFYQEVMRLARRLERGEQKVPYHDRNAFKEFVRKLPGVVVEENTKQQTGEADD